MNNFARNLGSLLSLATTLVLLAFGGRASAQQATGPIVDITPQAIVGNLADANFTEPVVRVFSDATKHENITNRFYINYDITGGTYGRDKNGNETSVDPTTGTSITRVYGDVTTGDKSGTVTVVVTAKPIEIYQSQYSTIKGQYTITLNNVKPSVEIISPATGKSVDLSTGWTAPDNSRLAFPQFRLIHQNGRETMDATSQYNITATSANADVATVSANGIITTKGTGTAPITFSFTPKVANTGFLPADNLTLTLNVAQVKGKIIPQLIFPAPGDSTYWGCYFDALTPRVLDNFGNDISFLLAPPNHTESGLLCLAYSVAPLAEGKTMHTPYQWNHGAMQETGNQTLPDSLTGPQWGANLVDVYGYDSDGKCQMKAAEDPAFYKSVKKNDFVDEIQSWNLDATAKKSEYTIKVYCQVYPNNDYGNISQTDKTLRDRFQAFETSYPLRVMLRNSEVMLDPDPNQLTFTVGETITHDNRFNVVGRHESLANDDKKDLKPGDVVWLKHNIEANEDDIGMNYSLKFKTGDARVDNFPDVEHNHKTVTENGQTYEVYYSVRGWNNDNTWTLTFLHAGDIQMQYAIYPWNRYWEGNDVHTVTFHVSEKVTPIVNTLPNPIVLYTTDTRLPAQPNTTITSAAGTDIKQYYNLSYELPEDSHGISYNEKTGHFEVKDGGLTEGEITVRVIATPKDGTCTFNGDQKKISDVYLPGETTFVIKIKSVAPGTTRFEWDIVDKQGPDKDNYSSYKPSDHGKLIFTKTGVVTAGYTIDAIPGLTVSFGNEDDSDWQAEEVEGDGIEVYGDAVALDSKGIPVSGTFYKLLPHTNGFLTIDGHFTKDNNVVIISEDGDERQNMKPNADLVGEAGEQWTWNGTAYKFCSYPLFAGKVYYLYNEGNGETYEPLRLHGINFLPAFINQRADHTPVLEATAYANGYSGSLPVLAETTRNGREDITYSMLGSTDSQSHTSDLSEFAEINASLGTVRPIKGTVSRLKALDNINVENHDDISTKSDRIKVYAKVRSNYKPNVFKMPFYDLLIADIPTYILQNQVTPSVGQEVETTNYKTHLRAWFGGWVNSDNPEARPYWKNNKRQGGVLTDSWRVAKTDSVGAQGRTIDNFPFSSFGTQNPTDENVGKYEYEANNEDLTYKVPCRGTYLRFEPEENGTLVAYILQNGVVAYAGDKSRAKKDSKLKLNPVYIVDEAGKPVKLQAWSISQYDNAAEGTDKFTEGILRMDYETFKRDCNNGNDYVASEKTNDSESEAIEMLQNIGWMSGTSSMHIGDQQKVYDIAVDGKMGNGGAGSMGYTVITKAYTRYSFKVKAGKTYFIFMLGSKLGNGGLAFLPDGWTPDRKDAPAPREVTLDEEGNDDLAKGNVDTNTPCNVKLYHKFSAQRWNSLCLPFSINQTQFRRLFGEDALAIGFDNFSTNETIDGEQYDNVARFTQHNYRWIVAGRPYFVLPGKNFKPQTDADGRQYVEIDSVTFEDGSYNDKYTDAQLLKRDKAFKFKGIYGGTTISTGDYFIGSGSDGAAKLYRATRDMKLKGYRAYIPASEEAKAKGMRIDNFVSGEIEEGGNNETTSIEPAFNFSGATADDTKGSLSGTYNMGGAQVDGNNMPAGVYIVNGKKVVKK